MTRQAELIWLRVLVATAIALFWAGSTWLGWVMYGAQYGQWK